MPAFLPFLTERHINKQVSQRCKIRTQMIVSQVPLDQLFFHLPPPNARDSCNSKCQEENSQPLAPWSCPESHTCFPLQASDAGGQSLRLEAKPCRLWKMSWGQEGVQTQMCTKRRNEYRPVCYYWNPETNFISAWGRVYARTHTYTGTLY